MEIIHIEDESKKENDRFWLSIYLAFIITAIFGFVKFSAWAFDIDEKVFEFGILPRTLSGLRGIIFSPLIHGDAGHYLGNAIPLFVLSVLILYFYRQFYFKVLLLVWLFDGIGVWLIGREVYHIGASGVVYGLAFFAFFSGVLKKNRNMLAMSMLVLFLYGSLIWGMYPLENGVSWEAHLAGFLTGTLMAVYYRKSGPPNDPVPDWMNQEEILSEEINTDESISEAEKEQGIIINYDFKKKSE
ncbi:rhomboid family intramembrane serine protease [Bacteroidota bacterium]|nr:rhomboid family intramembrane serine protease [Bacteroidota bacterium]